MLSYLQTTRSNSEGKYHAKLTESGIEKVTKAERAHEKPKLSPGIDYTVLDLDEALQHGAGDWLPFPECKSLPPSFRHTWILTRERVPCVPTLGGAPVPRHKVAEESRAAMITMTYFRPWTLRVADADEDVPFAGNLRPVSDSWQSAVGTWLDGNIVSEDSKRYVSNLISVHRMTPRGETSDVGNSDDILEDEELQITHTF